MKTISISIGRIDTPGHVELTWMEIWSVYLRHGFARAQQLRSEGVAILRAK